MVAGVAEGKQDDNDEVSAVCAD